MQQTVEYLHISAKICACQPTRLRTCKIYGGTFEIEPKAGRPRDTALRVQP